MDGWSTWGIPALVLVFGALAGWLATRQVRDERGAALAEGQRNDLVEQKQAAVAALKELELERDKLPAETYAAERERLLKEGAAALRALEEEPMAEVDATPAGLSEDLRAALDAERDRIGIDALREGLGRHVGSLPARREGMAPEWRGALWALLVVGVLGGLLFFLQGTVQTRAPGGSMTGNQVAEAPASPERQRWEDALADDPDDLAALNALTEIAFTERDLKTAMDLNTRALALAPEDLEARTYKAMLRASVGMTDAALEQLDAVLAEDPEYTKALVYKGLLALDAGRPRAAVDALEKAVAQRDNPFLQQRLALARQQLGEAGAPSPPATVVGGEIRIPEGLALSGTETVFVYVKNPAGGPPLAAVKLPARDFPLAFEVTGADRPPMGASGPLPDTFDLSVRIDADGNAMTREDSVAEATAVSVEKGTTGLQVELAADGP